MDDIQAKARHKDDYDDDWMYKGMDDITAGDRHEDDYDNDSKHRNGTTNMV